jgi:hypothetical protein
VLVGNGVLKDDIQEVPCEEEVGQQIERQEPQ